MSLIGELKRRNVFRAAGAYIVLAWIAIQVIETIFPVFGFDDAVIRISIIVLAIGFLPAVVLAWAFELTPEGLKHESTVNYSSPRFQKFGKRIDRLVIVLLVIALTYFAIDKFILSSAREEILNQQKVEEIAAAHKKGRAEALVESYGDKSIAVLPFVNMSDDAANEFFSDGISEELLNLLAKIPELRVTSRSSAFAFKDEKIDIPTIAEKLNVAHILEGSVRKIGNQVRITTQLVEARSDTHLWSETYDRQLDDIFAIQDEIASAVVEQLKITILDGAPKAREFDPQAYALYLEARHTHRLMTAGSLKKAQALYEQVLQIDPDMVVAMKGLASNLMNQENHGLVPVGEGYTRAHQILEEALLVDPDSVQIHEGLGWLAIFHKSDLKTAAYHYRKALKLEPADPELIGASAALLVHLHRPEEAIGPRRYALERDPFNPVGYANLGSIYYFSGHWNEAIESYQKALELSPGYIGSHYFIGMCYLMKGEVENAREAIMQEGDDEYRTKGTALVLHASGLSSEFQKTVAELAEHWGAQWPSEVAHVYAWTGDLDRAFEWLQKSAAEEEGAFNPIDPLLGPLHLDPRWQPLLHQIGKSPELLDSIEFSISLPQ